MGVNVCPWRRPMWQGSLLHNGYILVRPREIAEKIQYLRTCTNIWSNKLSTSRRPCDCRYDENNYCWIDEATVRESIIIMKLQYEKLYAVCQAIFATDLFGYLIKSPDLVKLYSSKRISNSFPNRHTVYFIQIRSWPAIPLPNVSEVLQ